MLNNERKHYMEQLYDQMYRKLMLYSLTALHDSNLAEEAVQEVFQIACSKVDDLLICPNPCGWLMNTLKFVIRNMKRRQERTNMLFVPFVALDDRLPSVPRDISPETEADCIQVLGVQDYVLLKRVALKELTIREAAEEFGLTETACSKRIQRSKKRLRTCLTEREKECS